MKEFRADHIQNVVLLGHGSCGKTTLAEAMLFYAKATDRLGKIEEGNTVCDFDPEEIKRRVSITSKIAPVEFGGNKINFIDTPGLFDFEGGMREGLRAADSAVIVLSGKSGVNVGTLKAYKAVEKQKMPRMFFVGKLNSDHADFYKVLEDLKSNFGPSVCPLVVPHVENRKVVCYINLIEKKAYAYDGKGNRSEVPMPDTGHRLDGLDVAIAEAVAETDAALFDKYFSGEQFTQEEILNGVRAGVKDGTIAPVFCGCAQDLSGIDALLSGITRLLPASSDANALLATDENDEPVEISVSDSDPLCAFVFKTVADPFVGKLSYFKVIAGEMRADTQAFNMRTGEPEKIGKLLFMRGKKGEDTAVVHAGDIGAVAKLARTATGDTLCAPSRKVKLEPIAYPIPTLAMAIHPKAKGDEEKVAAGLARLMEEDPTCTFVNNVETHEQVLSGLGDQHLDVLVSKLLSKFGVAVELSQPKVAYRETIRGKVKSEGKHKKQTGGHGQYGHVVIEFEPCEGDDLIFEEKVFGGSVPKGFFPAVEKGLREAIGKGVLAGYPMVGIKATLLDGSYHPVDSSEMAFKLAAILAYKDGIPKAKPVLLEPIGTLRVLVDDAHMGDVIGEINKRRGRVLGMEPAEDGMQLIEADVPMAAMSDFSTTLRSTTQGRGSYTLAFARYEDAPPQVAQKVIEESKTEA